MKCLVTGIAGLLGANFSRHLLEKKYKVIGIDNLSGGYKEFVPSSSTFYNVDITQTSLVDQIFSKEKPDVVFHFAAYAAEGLSPFVRNYNYVNNVMASVNIINAAINHEVKKIVYTSSMAVYGEGSPPFTEDQLPNPADPYGIAKYAVEMDLKLASEMFGLRYSIIRPHNVVGIYQNIWDKYRNVVGIWIRQALSNKPLTIYGDGTQVRAFSDVQFYMDPFEKLICEHDGEIFNIGADKYYELNDVANIVISVAKEFGINASKVYLEKRDEVHIAYCDHSKARNLLEFQDETNLEKTIRSMFEWAIKQPSRPTTLIKYEIQKNLYSFWKSEV